MSKRLPHDQYVELPIPDPITFTIGSKWLDRRIYPRQATMLKIIFLRTDLLTDYDYRVIEEWEQNFAVTKENGTPVGLLERMKLLRESGYHWFREVLFVMGRRGGKGYVGSIAMAYVLWNYMAKLDPQEHYGIDRDKQLECLIYAGKKEQARDHLWRDLINAIQGGPCFTPYLSRPMGESLSLVAPADALKRRKLAERGITSGLDEATFKIEPLPATPMSGRGGASFMIGMDEMAHMIATGANRAAEEVWKAATPALDQFKKDAFILAPSSPWEMIGQFYVEWEHACEIDPLTGRPVYPEIFMLQLTSWDPYLDWTQAHLLDLFPEDFTGDLGEYLDRVPPRLAPLKVAIQEYDDEMRKLERADPDNFAVERLSHWQTSLDAYLDPAHIAAMFDNRLKMTRTGQLSYHYKGHADPSVVNDMFGLAVAHTEPGEDGMLHVIFDHIHHWNPADYPEHTLDYVYINKQLWDMISGFPVDDFSFDQYNSQYFVADLQQRARTARLPKRVEVHVTHETLAYNLKVAETFKVALNQHWIHAPYYEQADLELRFLQFKNGKVIHQSAGPVVHDDVARSMMEVVYALLDKQVTNFMTQNAMAMAPAQMGGTKPWMSPSSSDMEVFAQFGAAMLPRQYAFTSPARGRAQFPLGRGPFPRTPGSTPRGRGRR